MDIDRSDKPWVEHDLDNYRIQKNVCKYILSNWMFFIWDNCVLLTASLQILGKKSRIYRMISHFYYSSYENFIYLFWRYTAHRELLSFTKIPVLQIYSILFTRDNHKYEWLSGVFKSVWGGSSITCWIGMGTDTVLSYIKVSIVNTYSPHRLFYGYNGTHDNDIWWVLFLPFLIMEWWRMKIIRSKDSLIQFWRQN